MFSDLFFFSCSCCGYVNLSQDVVDRTRFDLVLSLSDVQRLENLNWAVKGCLGWYYDEFWTGVVLDMPAYRQS